MALYPELLYPLTALDLSSVPTKQYERWSKGIECAGGDCALAARKGPSRWQHPGTSSMAGLFRSEARGAAEGHDGELLFLLPCWSSLVGPLHLQTGKSSQMLSHPSRDPWVHLLSVVSDKSHPNPALNLGSAAYLLCELGQVACPQGLHRPRCGMWMIGVVPTPEGCCEGRARPQGMGSGTELAESERSVWPGTLSSRIAGHTGGQPLPQL